MKKLYALLIALLIALPVYGKGLYVSEVSSREKVKAGGKKVYYNIVLNKKIVIKGAKIVNGKKGKFVSLPAVKSKNRWYPVCIVLDKKLREEINNAVINKKINKKKNGKIKITEVRVKKFNGKGKLKGFASVTLNNAFVIKSMKIIKGKNGLFVVWPSYRTKSGRYEDMVYILDRELAAKVKAKILEKYKKMK